MKASSAYSDLKPAWHLDKIAAMRRGEQVVPPHLQLIISDLCNQDCHFCAYRISEGFSSANFGETLPDGKIRMNPHRLIPTEKANEILTDAAALGVKAVQFTGGGEPTVHPEHIRIFAHAQELGLETALVSNGVILRKGWEEVYSRMAWIRISLDAGSPGTYATVRRTPSSHYWQVLSNIGWIASAVEGTSCLLGVGYVVTPENYKEIEQGVDAARQSGAAYIRLSASFTRDYDAPYRAIYGDIQQRIKNARAAFECSAFRVIDLFGERIEDLKQHAPDYQFCGYQQFNTFVGGDLKVYRCCNTAYTDHGLVGDLKDKAFADFFASPEKHEAYASFDARSCEVCQFNGKNRVINYLVGHDPTHVEFV